MRVLKRSHLGAAYPEGSTRLFGVRYTDHDLYPTQDPDSVVYTVFRRQADATLFQMQAERAALKAGYHYQVIVDAANLVCESADVFSDYQIEVKANWSTGLPPQHIQIIRFRVLPAESVS